MEERMRGNIKKREKKGVRMLPWPQPKETDKKKIQVKESKEKNGEKNSKNLHPNKRK